MTRIACPPHRSGSLLRVRHVSIWAENGRQILDDVSFSLKRGEILGIVGESGAGKSTLGLACLGHVREGLRIVSGEVWFDGLDLLSVSENELRALRAGRMAYVAQHAAASFNPALRLGRQTIDRGVVHGLMDETTGLRQAEAEYAALKLPDPDALLNRYPHQLSGGQLQRAMTAMAMICGPDLVVFDEPTSALDVATQEEVLSAIAERLRQSGAAALFISHDLSVVARMAQRILVLHRGRIVEAGETWQILRAPRHPYTQALVRSDEHVPVPKLPAEPVLEVRDVTAGYENGPDVVRNVSFRLEKGRTLALVGESGSGKSTLARVICGLLPPRSGQVLLEGRALPPRLDKRDKNLRQKIQLVHQAADLSLNPAHRVGDILARPLKLFFRLSKPALTERMQALLKDVELADIPLNRPVRTLSGGQKQRLAIARALAAEPVVMICDEITSALDAITRRDVVSLLKRLQEQHGLTVLFITHDLEMVRLIADEVAVMEKGRIVELRHAASVLLNPKSEAAKRLLKASRPMTDSGVGFVAERIQQG